MAATDVLELEEAKATVKSVDAALLPARITAVSQSMDAMFGPIVQREVTEEVEPLGSTLYLRRWPVASVDLVTEYDRDGIPTVVTADTLAVRNAVGFRLEPYSGQPDGLYSGKLLRRSSGSAYRWGAGGAEVVYTAGRYEDTAAVDERFKEAARVWLTSVGQGTLVGTMQRTEGGAQVARLPFPTFGLPKFVLEFLEGEYQRPGLRAG